MISIRQFFLLSVLCLGVAARPAEQIRVAYDDAGNDAQQPHLVAGASWRFEAEGGVPEAVRTVAYDESVVEYAYAGLNPQAAYAVQLRFFSDAARELRIKAGGAVLAESLVLEKQAVREVGFEIPRSAYADGQLRLCFEKKSGPNALVSEIEILSDDPAQLLALPEPVPVVPRLTPRPSEMAGRAAPILDLGGTWKFHPAPPAGFAQAPEAAAGWKEIQVPGEWVMQGFEVRPSCFAGYFRTFELAALPAGQRFKLRFGAVYSLCEVFVNGVLVGRHEGGFVPFEFDVTESLRPGRNTLALSVCSESMLDRLSCGSQYACHQLGGISRKVQLFSVPGVHLAGLKVSTRFDAAFRNAVLELEAPVEGGPAELQISLAPLAPAGGQTLPPLVSKFRASPGNVSIPVEHPAPWNPEHPNLHALTVEVVVDGRTVESVVQEIGFRQVEVKGTRLLVNGVPVKLRGACRHEVHPLLGRALGPEQWQADARLYRAMNCNLVRTSHYPPGEEFLAECDRAGLFVELEAPLCWVGHGASDHYKQAPKDQAVLDRLLLANLETVQGSLNHPSVILRSLANESSWSPLFAKVKKAVEQADPTRPTTFHDQCWGGGNNHGSTSLPVGNYHYPGFDGPAAAGREARPIYFGENTHLNAYNRLELATDPALRDQWGRYLHEMWEKIEATPGCLGQSIWAAMDDTFYLPNGDTVGYGTWGPLDGWRREKPEYWNAKKAYSPIHLIPGWSLAPAADGRITVGLENRYNFTDLQETRIAWRLGQESGTATASVPPGGKGALAILLKQKHDLVRDRLELEFHDPRGFVADQFCLPLVNLDLNTEVFFRYGFSNIQPKHGGGNAKLSETPEAFSIAALHGTWTVDRKSGLLASANGRSVAGPKLMLLPLNNAGETQMTGKTKVWTPFTSPCSGWSCSQVTAKEEAPEVVVTVAGKYDGAEGTYTLTFDSIGGVSIAYDFTVTKAVNPRQVGLVFSQPRECEFLSWDRRGYWDVYPEDHIARLKGTVKASEGFEATSVGPCTKPNHPWRLDNLPYGNNDFCSTKHNVFTASLLDAAGHGLLVEGGGKQHVRCWRTEKESNLLVADYSNGGSERFLRGLANKDDRPLKPGDKVSGTVRLGVK